MLKYMLTKVTTCKLIVLKKGDPLFTSHPLDTTLVVPSVKKAWMHELLQAFCKCRVSGLQAFVIYNADLPGESVRYSKKCICDRAWQRYFICESRKKPVTWDKCMNSAQNEAKRWPCNPYKGCNWVGKIVPLCYNIGLIVHRLNLTH